MKKKKIRLEDLIIELLSRHPNTWMKKDTLMSAFKLPRKKGPVQFEKAINRLAQKNRITVRNDQVRYSRDTKSPGVLEGTFSGTRHGSGYVRAEGHERDIRIPARNTATALDRDRVRVQIMPQSRSERTEGKIIEVIERGRSFYVGTFLKEAKNTFLIIPDEKSAHTEFFVHPDNVNKARHNDKVTFRLVDWLHPRSLPEAEVLEVLGKKGTHDASVLSILAENELQARFPAAVEQYADSVATDIPDNEYQRRRDLRDMDVFTIDPDDAKDFDDALSIEVLPSGNYLLGVHIADVSHYVQQGSLLDREAQTRATSVYLVDRVIPMLPESLSNGVCSLRPGEDKLCYSCFMEIAPDGKRIKYEIAETVIRSKKRFTYEEAQEVIDTGKGPHHVALEILAKMTAMLTSKRFREGSIDLDTPEPRFELDDKGKPLSVYVKERLAAHRLVEECMLMANKTVAAHISLLRNTKHNRDPEPSKASPQKQDSSKTHFPFIYRIHDRPDTDKLRNIAEMVRPLGIQFAPTDKKVSSSSVNELIRQANQTTLKYAINELILRSMAKAVYSPKNIGHYGLGFSEYSHFTSPIRRYPDLIAHRLLKQYASGLPGYSYTELIRLGDHCSDRERDAITAERDSVKLKQVEYMSERLGDTFAGVISGVTDKGLYVVLNESFCEGMVAMRDLDDDFYVYEQSRHLLRGRNRGKTYKLGDEMTVKAVRTNAEQRQIDFVPA